MKKILKSENTPGHRKAITWKNAWKLCSFLLVMLTAVIGMSIPSQAEEDEEEYALIDIAGYLDYEDAFAVLDLVNEERTAQGLDELEMDADLLDCAMYRAAELAVYYAHTRPDGSECFTALEDWEVTCTVAGENIAAGYESAEDVMEGWMNSDGHRANILGSDYTRVGIGIFIHEDVVYWVQMFTDGTAADPEVEDDFVEVDAPIFAVPSTLGKASLEIDLTQKVGEKGEAIMHITNAGWDAVYFTPLSDSVVYESSAPSVVKVDEEGTLKAVGAGSATIKASLSDLPSVSASKKVTIAGKEKVNLEFSSASVTKALGSKAFTVKPEYNGDGTITYTSSDTSVAVVDKNTGKVTLKGVGTTKITATASKTSTYDKATAAYTLKVIPSMPKLEKATSPSYTSVKITWSESKGADGYIVYHKVNGSWERLAVVKSATSYTQDNLICGQEYSFTVKAYKKLNGTTYYSKYDKEGITAKPALAKPKLEKATSPSYTSVKITWSESKGADGYIVYHKVDGSWKRLAVVKSATSYTQDNLICGQEYVFTVKAYKKLNGTTCYSSYDKNGITAKPTLAKPRLTELVKNSSTSVTLNWERVTGATGYIIYRKNDAGKWERLGVVKDSAPAKYIEKNLKKGKTYTYTVKAYRSADGIKSYSSYDKKGISITLK